ncbi:MULTISPECIES: molybdenum cofactor guanylyltransferase MobA [Pseudomonas fluorescens group]|uniref:Molybdenum cofactor guanylyltransferase n=1 Tax=Pseudomonas petroselini TaxID=2899822 RepID=A0ABS8QSB6_9PSED|nr:MULTISPECIES: molybdenum cofactor guanylyltransferase MobA [Pseudomonas fluorescens group]MCD7037948.1 molybdenum cofactor guanylyltransferase MobA [Pseudomonas petroselini]MCD7044689.1 molybdenum cofactor guanylyltransferase MobA [Pseudomonas petroselini]MCD7068351.1 molybdenum cofactor guanylyltransferase MobA [Pseudomonas petroselini]MCF5668297.1 molybdenum cofactor guanylyltransferase MobA [Pseudomonas marginalis]MCM2378866.1 molybdenum cofactor guanylyltransferase MobA [Pseudomonas mar
MPIDSSPLPCSVLLLSGGRGQRMGGQDKGLLEWRGQPLIAHLQRLARPLTDDLIISCNRNPERYADYADQLVNDDSPDFPGPLAGIRAGLAAARHEHLLILPCDVPHIDAPLLADLRETARRNPLLPVMVRHGEFWEPLICIIPTRLRAAVEDAWHAGERSPRKIFLQLGGVGLECPADDPRLANLNTPQLLQTPSGVSE